MQFHYDHDFTNGQNQSHLYYVIGQEKFLVSARPDAQLKLDRMGRSNLFRVPAITCLLFTEDTVWSLTSNNSCQQRVALLN